jgi:phosphatidylglycerophosphatase A
MTEPLEELAKRYATATPVHLEDFARLLADVWRQGAENSKALQELRRMMADQTQFLNDVAATLRDRVFPGVSELLARNATLEAAAAAQGAEEASESTAGEDLRAATDEVVGLFNANPDVPDLEPLPEPEPTPGEG